MITNNQPAATPIAISATPPAIVAAASIPSKNEPESAPSLLSYFAEHGENNALSLTLMALGNLAAVNSEAAAYVYTQCMNRGFMSQEVEEALGIGQNFGIQPVVNQGNVTYLGVARRMRAG